jgi:tRNA threonylcarbamoyladenosine biosynthesis protein TsaB
MWVLALDTTTRDGSVALVRDDEVVVTRPGEPGVSHAERVPHDLQQLLAEGGLTLAEIDLFAVATGPGAFTGLRIGVAAVQGLALALDRPAAGIPALDALAWDLFEREPQASAAGAWLEASRGEVFAAAYTRGGVPWPLEPLAVPTAALPEATVSAWRSVVPPGAPIALADASAASPTAGHVRAGGWRPLGAAASLAAVVGRLAVRDHARGAVGAPPGLAPVYVRRPDVEIERERRLSGAPRT